MNTIVRREKRKAQIESALALANMQGKGYLTMRQIARRLDMSPSSHLMSILWDMVDESRLVATPFDHRPNKVGWNFHLRADRMGAAIEHVYQEFESPFVTVTRAG